MYALYVCILTSIMVGSEKVPPIHRIVFQTFVLSDGAIVQCYGTCTKENDSFKDRFNATGCEGRRIRISCNDKNKNINIVTASIGHLNPVYEVCDDGHKFDCRKNIRQTLLTSCQAKDLCSIDIPLHKLKDECGSVKYISLDVTYTCAVMETTTPSHYSNSPMTEQIGQTLIPSTPAIISSSHATEKRNFFWLITCYSFLTESEFLKRNKSHAILAVILAIFVGLVISLCLLMEHSRRTKRKKMKEHRTQQEEQTKNRLLKEIDLENPPEESIQMKRINNKNVLLSVERETEDKYHSDDSDTREDENVDVPDHCKFKDGKDLTDVTIEKYDVMDNEKEHHSTVEQMIDSKQDSPLIHNRPFSLSHFPPPPKELLKSSSTEFIPPPWQFQGHEQFTPSLIVTSPTPLNISLNTLNSTPEKNQGNQATKLAELQNTLIQRSCLKFASSSSRQHQKHPNSLQITRRFKQEDKVKWSTPTVQRKHSFNDLDSSRNQTPATRNLTLNRDSQVNTNLTDCNRNQVPSPTVNTSRRDSALTNDLTHDSPLFHVCLDPGRHQNIPNISNNCNRKPKKGRLHVLATNTATKPNKTVKKNVDDDEADVDIEAVLDGDITQKIHKHRSNNRTSNLEQKEEDFKSNVVHNNKIEQEIHIEESGYHSIETGTESICSSNRSIDSRMFSPLPIQGILKKNGRESVRTVPRNTPSATSNSFKNKTSSGKKIRIEVEDIGPPESSMDDTSSRDSFQLHRTKVKVKRKDVLIENKKLKENQMKFNSESNIIDRYRSQKKSGSNTS